MSTESKMTMAGLRDGLIADFSLEELGNLCFDLDIRYESLPGSTIDAKAKELVAYCQRRKILPDLVQRLQYLRPAREWQVPVDAPLLTATDPDEALMSRCRELVTQIVDRVWATGERMNEKSLRMSTVPAFQLEDLRPYDPGLEDTLSIYHDGGCKQLRQVAMSILSARQDAVQAERSRLLAKQQSYGIQVPLALRRQLSQTQIQIGLLNLLAQLL